MQQVFYPQKKSPTENCQAFKNEIANYYFVPTAWLVNAVPSLEVYVKANLEPLIVPVAFEI